MKIILTIILALASLITLGQDKSNIFGKWRLLNHEEIDTIALNEGNIGFLYIQAMSLADRTSYVEISRKSEIVFMPVKKNGVRYNSSFQLSSDNKVIIVNLIGDEKEEYRIVYKSKKKIELVNKYDNKIILSKL
jgi:hypothetical protein